MNQWLAIFQLRFRLVLRAGGTRGPSGALVPLVLMSLLALWLSAGLGEHLRQAGDAAPDTVHLVLCGLWVLWATAPLLGYPFSEFHDVTRILAYPVSHRRAFLAGTLAGLVGPSVLPVLGIAHALLAGLPGPPATVALRAALLAVFLLHAAVLAQTLHLLVLSLLPRRQLRDVAMVLAPLFSLGLYLGFRVLVASEPGAGGILSRSGAPRALWALPPRWLSEVFVRPEASPGSIGLVAAFAGLTVVLVGLGARFQERAFYGEILDTRRAGRRGERAIRRLADLAAPLTAILPAPTRAVAYKEWVLLWREPVLTNQFLRQSALVLFAFLLPLFEPSSAELEVHGSRFLFLVGFLLLSQSPILSNLFGSDSGAVSELFARGQDRRHVFLGKNLCHLGIYLALDVAALGAFALLYDLSEWLAPYLFAAVLATVLNVACGNVASVYLSTPLARPGARRALEQQPERLEGCAQALVRSASGLASLAAAAPIALLTWVGFAFDLGPALAVAAAYAGGGWVLSIFVGAGLLAGREEALMARME